MKKQLLTFLMMSIITGAAYAQDYCRISSDTTINGSDSSAYAVYSYNSESKILKVEYTDSSSIAVDYFDTVYYDSEGRVDKTERYQTGQSNYYQKVNPIYDGNGRLSRVEEWGDNGNGAWTKAWDLVYNVNGELSAMNIDASSLSGQPEGMMANWQNIVWSNGNMIGITLVGDFTGNGVESVELTVVYDAKKNRSRLDVISEGADYMEILNQNNMALIKLNNNEPSLGASAGDTALFRTFTYNSYDEVESMEEFPFIFSERYRESKYTYDCSVSLGIEEKGNLELVVYPNPFSDNITIEMVRNIDVVKVFNIQGQQIKSINVNSRKMNLNMIDLPKGVYFIEVTGDGMIKKQKIVKY